MRARVIAILLKDVRHLRVALAVFYVLLVLLVPLQAVEAAPSPTAPLLLVTILWNIVTGLALWTVVALLIQEERLRGDRQFWLTRPYSVWELLLSKFLFVLFFVQLPVFVVQSLVLEEFHISPFDFLPAMLTKQALFAAFFILPAAALAARTANLRQFFGELTLIGIATLVVAQLATRGHTFVYFGDGTGWVRLASLALCLLLCSVAILFLQYRRSPSIVWPLALLIASVGATLTVTFFLPYSITSVIDSTFRPERMDTRPIQIAFVPDPSLLPNGAVLYSFLRSGEPKAEPVTPALVVLPFVVTHLPPGSWFHLEAAGLTQAPRRENQRSFLAQPLAGAFQRIGRDGSVTFYLGLDSDAVPASLNRPASLVADIRISLSEEAGLSAEAQSDGFLKLSGIGTCALLDEERWTCFSPYHGPALLASPSSPGANQPGAVWVEVFSLRESRAPITTTIGFAPLDSAPVVVRGKPPVFRAQWSAASFQRSVTLEAVTLSAYRHELPLLSGDNR